MKRITFTILVATLLLTMTFGSYAATSTTTKQQAIDSVVKVYNDSSTEEVPFKAMYDSEKDVVWIFMYGNAGQASYRGMTQYSTNSTIYKKLVESMLKASEAADSGRKIILATGATTDVVLVYSTTNYTSGKSYTFEDLAKDAYVFYSSKYNKWSSLDD